MSQTVSAMFDGNVLHPEQPLDLQPNKRYRVTVEEISDGDAWDVLESMIGQYDGPEDWSAEHDHYLYGTPKRNQQSNPDESQV